MLTQRGHLDLAHRKIMDGIDTFLEIMEGPNPLTKAEIQALALKRPEKYAKFLPYASKL